jgi:hypothetical protein
MFVPVPPQSNQPEPTPPEARVDTDADAALDDDAPELDMPTIRRLVAWPAVVRWARLCRVLAYVSLVIFGFLAARNLYFAVANEPQFGPFMPPPVSPGVYLGYALLCVIFGIASCISLLGFAELLHVIMSIEAAAHRQRDRASPSDQPEG